MHMKIGMFILLVIFSFPTVAKKACQQYRDKLQNIQAQQRQGHTAKQSVRLHQREQKAWKTWQDCKKGKLASKKKRKQNKATVSLPVKARDIEIVTLKQGSAFDTKQGVRVKADFSGADQQAWLDYYQMPVACRKPKTTQQFAFCMEDREKQKLAFSQLFEEE